MTPFLVRLLERWLAGRVPPSRLSPLLGDLLEDYHEERAVRPGWRGWIAAQIRMALGARPRTVMGLVLRQSAVLIAIGLIAGLSGAAAVTRVLEGLLFGLTPFDGATFLAASLLFAAVAALASWIPARRATRIEPVIALRGE
jgi:hypothetical protein